jgi:hypothetical protein
MYTMLGTDSQSSNKDRAQYLDSKILFRQKETSLMSDRLFAHTNPQIQNNAVEL